MRILAAILQVEVNPVQNASFVFVSSGFGEFETGLFGDNHLSQCGRTYLLHLQTGRSSQPVLTVYLLTWRRDRVQRGPCAMTEG